MKKIALLGLLLVAIFGCVGSGPPKASEESPLKEIDGAIEDVTVNGTRCIVYDGFYSGAIACDFAP